MLSNSSKYVVKALVHLVNHSSEDNKILYIESFSPIVTPSRYRNNYGQLLEHSPFCERDYKLPQNLETIDEKGEFKVKVKKQGMMHTYYYAYHPFDVVGWDGFHFPYAISIHDFEPITGRIHLPPPIHQQFEGHNYVVCSFVPRLYDYHPDSIPAPYHHSNVDSDEILYDVDGVKISNATIHGGGYGVLTVGTSAATKDFLVMNNTFAGIRNDGVGIRIVNSDSAKVFGNRIIGSDYASGCYSGIDVFELSPKANVQILNNTITGCDFGIFTVSDPSSSGINIHRNILFDNDDGIFLVGSRNSQINGNHAYLNASVGIGLFEGSIGNSILKNTASGNGAWDMAHTPDSMPNRWSGNTCSTSDGAEVDCP